MRKSDENTCLWRCEIVSKFAREVCIGKSETRVDREATANLVCVVYWSMGHRYSQQVAGDVRPELIQVKCLDDGVRVVELYIRRLLLHRGANLTRLD